MDETVQFSSEFMYDLVCAQIGITGDLNQDESINVLDIVILVNLILSSDYNSVADLNGDSTLNVLDVVLLVNIVLGSFAGISCWGNPGEMRREWAGGSQGNGPGRWATTAL